jgi:short-subunit dehydrogenase
MGNNHKTPRMIVITGASSGIGEALALYYAQSGVTLALSGRDQARLDEVAQKCRERGAEVTTAIVDVANREAMKDWLEEVDRRFPVDLVIANAGISAGTGGVLQGEPPDQVRRVFDINLYGVLNTIEPLLPRMMERGDGQIAIMSSLAGFKGFPGAPAYGASKAAVRIYGEALRGSVRETGVRVNVICPGFIKSRMTHVNEFPMPFIMDTKKAAGIIVRGLARNKGRIAFPLPMFLGVWFLALLPDNVAQRILCSAPTKTQDKL